MNNEICPVPRCGKRMRIGPNGYPKGVCCGGCYTKIATLRSIGRDIPQPSQLTAEQLADLLYPVATPAPTPAYAQGPVQPVPWLAEALSQPEPTDRPELYGDEPNQIAQAFRDAGNDRAQVEALGVLAPQPDPTNTEGDVWQELIEEAPEGPIRDLMIARRAQGIQKYGRPLGRENGRDHVADAIQEALDGMVYCHAAGRRVVTRAFEVALRRLMEGDESPTLMQMDRDNWKKRALEAESKWSSWALRAEAAEAKLTASVGIPAPPSDRAELAEAASEAHRKDRDYWRTHAEAADAVSRQATARAEAAESELARAYATHRELCVIIGLGETDSEGLIGNVRHLAEAYRAPKTVAGLDWRKAAQVAADGLAGAQSDALLTIHRMALEASDVR